MDDIQVGWGEYVRRMLDRLRLKDLQVGQRVALYYHTPGLSIPEFSWIAYKRLVTIQKITQLGGGYYYVTAAHEKPRAASEIWRFNPKGQFVWLYATHARRPDDVTAGDWITLYERFPNHYRHAGYLIAEASDG